MPLRVRFLIDGFNLYHSVKRAEAQEKSGPLRWLDIKSLCQTLVQSAFGPGHSLAGVHYFSALAKHLEAAKPDVVKRHQTFITALESTGVEVSLANFKKKERQHRLSDTRVQVNPFRRWFRLPVKFIRVSTTTHEEKETDVAIACKLLELLCNKHCDIAVLMSGDTDLAPAIRTAKALYPSAEIGLAFPFKRENRDLAKLVKKRIAVGTQLYKTHQFPPTITLANGSLIAKPANW